MSNPIKGLSVAIRGLILILIVVVAAVLIVGYEGREAVVTSQRAGCARGVTDRAVNAAAWYAAYQARTREAAIDKGAARALDLAAATVYRRAAWSLNSRVDRDHTLIVDGRAPLGYGHLDCARAFPAAHLF